MWEKLYSSVINVLDINQATLSGCVDIICVRHKETVETPGDAKPAGTSASGDNSELKENERWVYRSTPFHVRFGKAKLLKSREKTVSIYVNGALSPLTMKLGAAGEAFFGEDDADDKEHPSRYYEAGSFSYDASDASDYSDEGPISLIDYGYYACSNSRRSYAIDKKEKRVSTAPSSMCIVDSKDNQRSSTSLCRTVGSSSSMGNDKIQKEAGAQASKNKEKCKTNEETKGSQVSLKDKVEDQTGDHQWSWTDRRAKQGEGDEKDHQLLEFSLCGHLLTSHDEEINKQFFQANIVEWESLNEDPCLWYHSSLVARFDGRPPYYPSKIALPLLASWIVFNKPLSSEAISSLLRTMVVATPHLPRLPHRGSFTEGDQHGYHHYSRGHRVLRRYRLAIRPTSEQLASLNLKLGPNNIRFSVSSPWQGTKSVTATLYLWPADAKLIISDVDGTITRSDALGHIMPILGRDWSHTGVAKLFTKIRDNGYHVVYMTARAIGQAEYTREYLFGLTQKEKDKLPRGPLFLSPDRLLPSFKREVISRSAYMFKIPALRDIRNLFPADHNPFCAGFGNNESDHRAYVSVGIPDNRVFIINPSGLISHVNPNFAKTYESMSDMAAHMFPPCNQSENAKGQ